MNMFHELHKQILIGSLIASTAAIAEPVPEIDCLIEPNMMIELSSPVAGVLDTISVDRSDTVKKGQVVATLKSDIEQVQLRASKETLNVSRVEQKRANALYRDNALTLSEKEQSDHEVALNKLEVESALANLELRKIRSPIDGVVADRYLMPGEFIEDNPILKLAQLDPLRVEVVAPVTYFGRVKTGMHAQVKTEFGSFVNLVAEVVVVDKVIDAASGQVTRYAQSMQAYTNPEYQSLLAESGFEGVEFYPSLTGDDSEAGGDLFALVGRKCGEAS